MCMTEAVVFDLDDTLLRNDRTISDFTVDVMRSLAGHGIRILPASGRARESMEGFVRQLNCCDTFIACNGAEIWNTDGNCLYASVLPPDVAQDIIAFGKKYHVYMHTYDGPYFYYNVESHWSREYASATLLTGRWKPDLEQFLPAI